MPSWPGRWTPQAARRYPTALAFAAALETAARGEEPARGEAAGADAAAPSVVLPGPAAPASRTPAVVAAAPGAPAVVVPASDAPAPATSPAAAVLNPGNVAASTAASTAAGIPSATRGSSPAHQPDEPLDLTIVPRTAAVPTLGEFAVEQALDPLHQALEDEPPDEDLVDFVPEPGPDTIATPALAPSPVQLDDDADEDLPPLRVPEATSLAGRGDGMFRSSEIDDADHGDRSRIMPIAIGLLIGALSAFPLGYFLGNRDRVVRTEAAATAPSPAPEPVPSSGAGGADQPRQSTEQAVTPPKDVAGSGAAAVVPTAKPGPASITDPAARGNTPSSGAAHAKSPASVAPAPARTGELIVRSTPSRAAVILNGRWRGRTPVTIDNLPFGSYAVRVVASGFRSAREDVKLNAADASQTVNARLQAEESASVPSRGAAPPAAATVFTGSLFVDSRPRGASVLLDGKAVGITPLALADVRIGTHVVRLELTGKRSWSSTTRVSSGETSRVTGSLEDK